MVEQKALLHILLGLRVGLRVALGGRIEPSAKLDS